MELDVSIASQYHITVNPEPDQRMLVEPPFNLEAIEDQNAFANFERASVSSFLRILPDTCSFDGLEDGRGCAFQIPLGNITGTAELNLQVALDTCPGTIHPYMSLRLGGAGASKIMAPCTSDDQCGAGNKCIDWTRWEWELNEGIIPDGFAFWVSAEHNVYA